MQRKCSGEAGKGVERGQDSLEHSQFYMGCQGKASPSKGRLS